MVGHETIFWDQMWSEKVGKNSKSDRKVFNRGHEMGCLWKWDHDNWESPDDDTPQFTEGSCLDETENKIWITASRVNRAWPSFRSVVPVAVFFFHQAWSESCKTISIPRFLKLHSAGSKNIYLGFFIMIYRYFRQYLPDQIDQTCFSEWVRTINSKWTNTIGVARNCPKWVFSLCKSSCAMSWPSVRLNLFIARQTDAFCSHFLV